MLSLRREPMRPEERVYAPPPARSRVLERVFQVPTADARSLQAQARAWAEAESEPQEKWSARLSLAFAVGASAILWGGIIALGFGLVRAFA